MYTGPGDSRSRREDYRTGQVALFCRRLRDMGGIPEPQVQDAIAALVYAATTLPAQGAHARTQASRATPAVKGTREYTE